jgi:TolB protein
MRALFSWGLGVLFCGLTSGLSAQNLGAFEQNSDVGQPKLAGSATYDAVSQTYQLSGAGENMWDGRDQFQFLHKKIKGDFIISATIQFVGKGVDPHRKIGIIARESLSGDSRYADACVHGDELTSLQYRDAPGANTAEVPLSVFYPTHIQLERNGNTFIFSAATAGQNYKSVSKELALNEELFAGLFICSHRDSVLEKAIFSNVRLIIPIHKNHVPNREYIGSHIEVMEVQTGKREIVHSSPKSLQAPNWTKDGKTLLYNSEGLMYKFDLASKKIEKLNTGPVIQNNNDHVISFNGKMLALSSFENPGYVSTLYTMPIGGADQPKQVTKVEWGHSFLHGWSPDGKKLAYTAYRNKQFDICTVDLATGVESQLTNSKFLDDSPEYSPDGQWIYFNSVRTGTMKLWRMKPDGSKPEQLTFDEYNDWFPHISPDGKWILFMAYLPDINPSEHPWYKQVYLRLMPVSGGAPRTIAYIYGGQGTINTPSWSPDGKKVAFVSNSKL